MAPKRVTEDRKKTMIYDQPKETIMLPTYADVLNSVTAEMERVDPFAVDRPSMQHKAMLSARHEVAARRFGSVHDEPCVHPNMITCTFWECQTAGRCKDAPL